jgi:peroxiredoxin
MTAWREKKSLAITALCVVCACCLCEAGEQGVLGRQIADFALPDYHGKDHSLAEWSDSKLVVIAFLGTECPLARLYGPRLQELSEQYGPQGVAFVGIDANEQDSLTDMAAYARHYGLKFPFLKDRDQSLADQCAAQRNPEVYVLDGQRKIRYRGRIDDQYGLGSSSGYARSKITSRDLGTALDELLAGKEVSQPVTTALGCLIGRKPKTVPHGEVTFTKHIAALLQDRCVRCHRPGEIGPFALTDYREVVGWADMIREVVSQGRMPPWSADPQYGHFANDARMSDAEKQLLFSWIDNGCPEGDPADLPPGRQWTDGWQIAQPDQVVTMARPFKVPAEGVVAYQYFAIDPGWKEDKWIQAAEVRPGNRAVVHHIIAFVLPPGTLERLMRARGGQLERGDGNDGPQATQGEAIDDTGRPRHRQRGRAAGGRGAAGLIEGMGALTAYVPGGLPTVNPPGVATFVPAGSKIVFQMHYTPNGTAQEDQSYLGVVFADPASVKKRSHGGVAGNRTFAIPPRADDYEVTSEYKFARDQLLVWMSPHMHLRGKSFRFEAEYPDGRREVLLNVPKYDFNWQLRYELAEPKLMPAGTVLHCTAHFDNSENNVANPNPDDTVRWGPQTWHEMMLGFFSTIAVENDAQLASAAKDRP